MKELIVIGGPNGAGKTTAATTLLPARLNIPEFVNADEIARGLSPFNADGAAIAAGRLMIERIDELIRLNQSFAFETTCAAKRHVRTVDKCRALGYRVTLIFLWLPSPAVAISRVAQRVRGGGHHIADDVIKRRYWTGLKNMIHLYLPAAEVISIYDSSDDSRTLIAERLPGEPLIVHDRARWSRIERATR